MFLSLNKLRKQKLSYNCCSLKEKGSNIYKLLRNIYGKFALHVGKVRSLVSRIIENPREKGKNSISDWFHSGRSAAAAKDVKANKTMLLLHSSDFSSKPFECSVQSMFPE